MPVPKMRSAIGWIVPIVEKVRGGAHKKHDVTKLLALQAVLCGASAYLGAQLGNVAVIFVPITYVVLIVVWCTLH